VTVAKPGGTSTPFTITVEVKETQPDLAGDASLAFPGDINLAAISLTLSPVGPGSPVTTSCISAIEGSGYDARLIVSCPFTNVPVNTYAVVVVVNGGYYQGGAEEVLTVYDPSLDSRLVEGLSSGQRQREDEFRFHN